MPPELRERFRRVNTSMLSDALFRLGTKRGPMDAGIKPVIPNVTMVGPAFTVKTYPGATHGSDLALQHAGAGDVIVIDGEGFAWSVLWGGIYSARATAKGIAGTVIDGAVRDIDHVRQLGYPLFARHVCPRSGTFDRQAEMQIPVSCGGTVVCPGDLVVGDDTGVVVVPRDRLGEVLVEAEKIRAKEHEILVEIGLPLPPDSGIG